MLKFIIVAGIIVLGLLLLFGLMFYIVKPQKLEHKTKRERDLESSAHEAKQIFFEMTKPNINNANIVEEEMRKRINKWTTNYNEIR